jgi:hypothetical protein
LAGPARDDDIVQALLVEHQGDAIDAGLGIEGGSDGLLGDVGEQGDLLALRLAQLDFGPAHQHVRLDADGPQFLHGMLRGLGLDLVGGAQEGHQGQVHEHGIAAVVHAELADRFEERQRLDITHRAADFDHGHIEALRGPHDPVLDLVGHVRDHLDGSAEIVAAPLLGDHVAVDAAGGAVVDLAHSGTDEAFVMAEVQVGLGAVFGHEDLAVLEGAHRARVDIDIGVQLEQRNLQPARFQDGRQGGRRETLAEGRYNATGNENERCHARTLSEVMCQFWKYILRYAEAT